MKFRAAHMCILPSCDLISPFGRGYVVVSSTHLVDYMDSLHQLRYTPSQRTWNFALIETNGRWCGRYSRFWASKAPLRRGCTSSVFLDYNIFMLALLRTVFQDQRYEKLPWGAPVMKHRDEKPSPDRQ